MYCPKCGKENPKGSTFCMHCGADLSGDNLEISPKIEVSPKISVSAKAEGKPSFVCRICGKSASGKCGFCGCYICGEHANNIANIYLLNQYVKEIVIACPVCTRKLDGSGADWSRIPPYEVIARWKMIH
jgi:hypothetical protein